MALRIAIEQNNLVLVKLLIENGNNVINCDSFNWACENGHLEIVKLMIEHGTNVKIDIDWSIKCASENGHLEVVKLLLASEHGANIKEINVAIKYASRNGHLEVVKLLIVHGADINVAIENFRKNKECLNELIIFAIEKGIPFK